MASIRPHVREKFDPGRKLVAAKQFTLFGRQFHPGHPFDRTLTTTRRIRQLYDAHFLKMTPDRADNFADYVNSSDSELLELSIMSSEELTSYLTARGSVPRYGSSRVQLLKKAESVLKAEREAGKQVAA